MNVPAIAKKSFDELQNQAGFKWIISFVSERLAKISNRNLRAQFVHKIVDEYNEEIFSHPLVKQFSPCKIGCSACCHTQVSVTQDEAHLLAKRINEGIAIDTERLRIQSRARNDSEAYFNIKYEDRKCIFLGDQGACQVYEDRPSVCRTNAVIGDSSQCDTGQSIQKTILVKTPKADMAIYASYQHSKESGSLPYMIQKILKL